MVVIRLHFFMPDKCFPFFDGTFLPDRSGSNIGDSLTVDLLVLACYFDFAVPGISFRVGLCLHNATDYVINVLCSGHCNCYAEA